MYYAKNTTNQSFIDMWRYLQRSNVTNNIFMLETNHKELVNFSWEWYKSLDQSSPEYATYRELINDECENNIWFYFREIVMGQDYESPTTQYSKHFTLTPRKMLMIYLFNKVSYIALNLTREERDTLALLWEYASGIGEVKQHRTMYFAANKEDSSYYIDMRNMLLKRTAGPCPVNMYSNYAMSTSMKNIHHYKFTEEFLYREYGVTPDIDISRKDVLLDIKKAMDESVSYKGEMRNMLFAYDPNMTPLQLSILYNFYKVYLNKEIKDEYLYAAASINEDKEYMDSIYRNENYAMQVFLETLAASSYTLKDRGIGSRFDALYDMRSDRMEDIYLIPSIFEKKKK